MDKLSITLAKGPVPLVTLQSIGPEYVEQSV